MKHKQFERWILDDAPLDIQQRQALDAHLLSCQSCRVLQKGWSASKQLITQSAQHKPAPGFTARWQQTVIKERQIEKIRRYRISMFFLIVAVFMGALTYLITSGQAMQSLANSLSIFSDLIIKTTSGLSTMRYWFNRLPVAVPFTIGFVFFGFLSAFMMVGIFFLWNIQQRKLQTHEVKID